MSESEEGLSGTSPAVRTRRRVLLSIPKMPGGHYRVIHNPKGTDREIIAADESTAPEEHIPTQPSIVQVEAAKLRLVTDRRLGKQSPEWLQRVAKGLPPQSVKAAG